MRTFKRNTFFVTGNAPILELEMNSLQFKKNDDFLRKGDSLACIFLAFVLVGFSNLLNAQQHIEKQYTLKLNQSSDQTDSNLISQNFVHFELRLNHSENKDAIYKAIDYFPRIEMYRMVDRRRIIQLSDNLGEVELYSSKELQESSGRSIRPQNIKSESEIREVEFYYSNQGYIKEILK